MKCYISNDNTGADPVDTKKHVVADKTPLVLLENKAAVETQSYGFYGCVAVFSRLSPFGIGCRLASFVLLLLMVSCASIQDLAKVQKPQVEISNLRLEKLDLNQLDFILELKVQNPNAVGLSLSKLDYDFFVEGNSLVKGTQAKGVQLTANSTNTVEIPVTINPANLWETVQKVAKQDRFSFTLASLATFVVPVLGDVQLPLKKTGELPVLHVPDVKIIGLKRKTLSFTRAEMELSLQVQNSNAFSLLLNQFTYNFQVNNRSWAVGRNTKPQTMSSKKANTIQIPITLNFLEIGTAAYQMLTSKAPLNYSFNGQFDFGSPEPFLKSLKLPVDFSGSLRPPE